MNRPKYYQNLAKFPGMQNTTQDCAIQVRVVFCLVFLLHEVSLITRSALRSHTVINEYRIRF